MNVAVFVSGTGSNLKYLLDYEYESNIEFKLVFSDKHDPPALKYAREHKIQTRHHSYKQGKAITEKYIVLCLEEFNIDFIVLAGYMRILSPYIIDKYPKKIINIHPSLLPLYKGLDTHRRAIDNGDAISGCTIHYVDSGMDTGEVIDRAIVSILPEDTPETLAESILIEEHTLYPKTLDSIIKENKNDIV